MGNITVCKDHLGNVYSSFTVMCSAYGKKPSTVRSRLSSGMSLEDALTTDKQLHRPHSESVYDHRGNEYPNEKAMCKAYGIPYKCFRMRFHYKKWSLEKSLTTPIDNTKNPYACFDHLGNHFGSIREMLDYHGNKDLSCVAYRNRMCICGWSREEAITIPRNMYIGKYRVTECLKRLNVKFYHDCSIKTIFAELNIFVDWHDFLMELQANLNSAGYNWSKQKIQRLRPDFVLYTNEDNKIRGVIEFDGEQHQNFIEFFFKTIEEFYRRSDVDFVKQSFWEYMNIPMLRIRHDQIDMIDDMVRDFIDKPQNYIHNHNTYLSEDEYWSILTEQKQQLELAFAV